MIPLPLKPKIVLEEQNKGIFEIEGLYPGYGQTIGNSLRRVCLSSLRGAAITSVKIEGVEHEFSTIPEVKEDVVELILNLKQVRFRLYEDGPFTISLSVKGEKEVRAKDFKTPSQVEIVTPDVYIATLTSKKASLNVEAIVESGLGYVPTEVRSKDKVEVGTIALDAAFSPVRHVNYEVENMRVGDKTDYNRVRLTIDTDGSIKPREALLQTISILKDQFGAIIDGFSEIENVEVESAVKEESKEISETETDYVSGAVRETVAGDTAKIKLDELKISNRTLNALREAGIKTVGGVARKREESLREIEGIGDKGIQEIKKALGNLGITLKQ